MKSGYNQKVSLLYIPIKFTSELVVGVKGISHSVTRILLSHTVHLCMVYVDSLLMMYIMVVAVVIDYCGLRGCYLC